MAEERCAECGRRHRGDYRCEHGLCLRCHLYSCPLPVPQLGCQRVLTENTFEGVLVLGISPTYKQEDQNV